MPERRFGMACGSISIALLAMGHRFLRMRNSIHDVPGWGRISVTCQEEGDCNAMNHSPKDNYARYIFFTHKELNSG